MTAFICATCGVQHAESGESPPQRCTICEDERQYIGRGGQRWTTLAEMKQQGRSNALISTAPGLTSIYTQPHFAIGQRALLVQTEHGNFLWDCQSYIDDATVARVNDLGGLHGISVSHPHFYGIMIEWSHAFGGAPVYIPAADRDWIVRPDPAIQHYDGSREVWPGLTLIQVGGHFEGSGVLHWAGGAQGRGALLTGDSISVAADRRYVTFMRSYPNYIPLPEPAIRRIVESVEPFEFEHVYGGWLGNDVLEDGKAAVVRSGERYIAWTHEMREP